jgi:hypothetical protein
MPGMYSEVLCCNSSTDLDSFGIPAVLLEMVPIAGILFSFTNTVGAALWAADMETRDASGQKTTAPGLRNQAAEARKQEL